tara:strand:+ start:6984 stop:8018 length:1035 start_codon:yes stop_codon:yes gene_type:complete
MASGVNYMKGMLKGMKQRPAGMTYKTYKGMCKAAGSAAMDAEAFKAMPIGGKMDMGKMQMAMKGESDAEDADAEKPAFMEEDDDAGADDEAEDEDEDEGDDMERSHKSVVSASDLLKSIDAYDATQSALRQGGTSRESYLTAKQDAGTLTKSERRELGRLWAQEDTSHEEPMHKSLYDIVSDDEDAGALVDASDFLKSMVSGVDTRMTAVADEVGRQGRATRELLKAQGSLVKSLARIVAQQDNVITALGSRLGTVESSPAPRRAISARQNSAQTRVLAKSVAGGAAGSERLSKSQIQSGLRTLMLHASEEQDNPAMDKITHATALYEQTGRIPNNILAAIRAV